MTSRRRPLAASSIADPEALHADFGNDPATRDMLREDLSHRSTERARKLREQLGVSVATKPVRALVTPQPAPAASPRSERILTRSDQPQIPDQPRLILSVWTALEALSPQTYQRPEKLANDDPRCIAPLREELPWTLQDPVQRLRSARDCIEH